MIVISKLGLDQFDADDLRLLEVLAGHASVALVNAQLYEGQRREAESAKALLELARELSTVTELSQVADRVAAGAARSSTPVTRRCGFRAVTERSPARAAAARTPSDGSNARPRAGRVGRRRADGAHGALHRRSRRLCEPLAGRGAARHGDLRESHRSRSTAGPARSASRPSTADDYGDRELELLGGIANQAKLAISNALAFGELERTFLSTVEALANALEAKDEYTHSHARWITDVSLRVGRELGLDQLALKRLELARSSTTSARSGFRRRSSSKRGRSPTTSVI